ncbi:diaminopimelate epimerase [Corynebacterium tapiri]|uniref:Diaminopimelate epimerase n=1 Tax=Corynebacterium tapiri TaxID=1448266 RepID=A0A5C4U6E7_9CORY|nr:diaminopimelate epimerase [Corynebacterium tapiri]TNL99225.1 diaminopimelate epimerase [Corynebacterium tapiri]
MTARIFAKGHGTENDFVIIPDEHGEIDLSPDTVAFLCDRRAGIGGDGLLRVVRAKHVDAECDPELWFMDYRNADGSIAEMCGNGVRVFAHWLAVEEGLQGSFRIGTRAGEREVTVHSATESEASVTVGMGAAEVTGVSTALIGSHHFAGLGVDVGNPHLACVVPGMTASDLEALELVAPEFDPEFFPAGVNVEVLTPLEDGRVHMRVWERGVGETRSCGTGTVAAARAALADAGQATGSVTVVVPGGEVQVTIEDENCTLTGPSRIVARGHLVV